MPCLRPSRMRESRWSSIDNRRRHCLTLCFQTTGSRLTDQPTSLVSMKYLKDRRPVRALSYEGGESGEGEEPGAYIGITSWLYALHRPLRRGQSSWRHRLTSFRRGEPEGLLQPLRESWREATTKFHGEVQFNIENPVSMRDLALLWQVWQSYISHECYHGFTSRSCSPLHSVNPRPRRTCESGLRTHESWAKHSS